MGDSKLAWVIGLVSIPDGKIVNNFRVSNLEFNPRNSKIAR